MNGRCNNFGSRYFKWTQETRLLLMETVKMVEEDAEFKLHCAGKVRRRPSDCGLAVLSTHKKKWEEVASRLPPVFNNIDHSKLKSTCYSQFVKLQQRLKSMKRDRHDRYTTADGKRDPLMTDELCRKITEYRATFRKAASRKDDFPLRIDDKQTTKQLASGGDGPPSHRQPHPLQRALRDGGHTPVSNVYKPYNVRSKTLAADKSQGFFRGGDVEFNQLLSETKLCKVQDYPRTGLFRWSEAARLQVIHAVNMMDNNLTGAGQIRSWKDVAAGLPMKLFWDIDVDRLASIAQKQFNEMKRRYRILKENERSGAARPITFKSMTKNVIRELEIYEEGQSLHRVSQTASHCDSSEQERHWITKRPSQARHDHVESSGARGAVIVETFPSLEMDIEKESFPQREISDPVDDNSIFPGFGIDPSSSDYCKRKTSDGQTAVSDSNSEEDDNKELLRREARYCTERKAASAQTFTGCERKEAFFSFEGADSEEDLDELRNRRTMSPLAASAANYSEPDNEDDRDVIECLSGKRRCYSSAFSCRRDHSRQGDFINKQNVRFFCDRAKKRVTSISEDGRQNPCKDENYYGGERFLSSERRGPKSGREHSDFGSQTVYDWSSVNSDSERSLHDNHDNSGENQQHLKSATHNYSKGSDQGTVGADENATRSTGNPQNGSCESPQTDDDQQSEDLCRQQADYDSATNDNQLSGSQGGQNMDAEANNYTSSYNSESGGFVQRESRNFQNGRSKESLQWKSRSSADPCHWNEGHVRSRQTCQSHDNLRHRKDFNRDSCPPRMNYGEIKQNETIPSSSRKSKMTKSAGPGEQDETSEGPSLLHEVLNELDLEFSRLRRWLKHRLFPAEAEKITNVLTSEACMIANAPNKKRPTESWCHEADSKGRRKRIRCVLETEFQRARLKLAEVFDKNSQTVIQELLESFKVSKPYTLGARN